jgi:hypothetical protein
VSEPPIESDASGDAGRRTVDSADAHVGLREQRGQLLRRLIATEDRLQEAEEELRSLRSVRDVSRRERADDETPTKRVRVLQPERRRILLVLPWLVAVLGAAAAGVGLSELIVNRPARTRLAAQLAATQQDVARATGEANDLRQQLAAKAQEAGSPRPPERGPSEDKPTDAAADKAAKDLAATRKELEDALARTSAERAKLAQQQQQIDLEKQRLADGRKALEEERKALPKRPEFTPAAITGWPISVVVWRADVLVPTAVMITGSSANFGSVLGGLPGKPAAMGFVPYGGATVSVIEGPSKANNWSRLYFKVEAKGPVTIVFILWNPPPGGV